MGKKKAKKAAKKLPGKIAKRFRDRRYELIREDQKWDKTSNPDNLNTSNHSNSDGNNSDTHEGRFGIGNDPNTLLVDRNNLKNKNTKRETNRMKKQKLREGIMFSDN